MLPAPKSSLRARLVRFGLALDSWIDSAFFASGARMRDRWQRFSLFMDRFHVSGWRKVAVGLTCEALTLGTAGSILMLALAIPAFREIKSNYLKANDLAVTFQDRYGQEIGKRGIKHDDSVRLDEFPDHLIKAVLSTEDRRFFEHFGIDVIGTARALSANARASGVVQGGSSITQQLAKNLFLSNERSLERKIKEAFLALWLEFHLDKNEILKLYLDRAYMGGGTIGIAAAADFYFGKSVRDVTLSEAAMLAGLFKAPTKYAPHVNLPAARARASTVLSNMVEAGFLTEGQVLAARRNPATPVDRKRESSPDFYLDWAFDAIKKLDEAGKLGSERVLVVRTPHDPQIQRRAEGVIEEILRQHGDNYDVTQAAMVVMDPDGAVRAIVGGRDYGESQFNRATDALRQPGSSWKPFVYAAALTHAPQTYAPMKTVVDRSVCIGDWCPKNYGGSFAGAMPLWIALAKSINTIPVQMSMELAPKNDRGERVYRFGRERIIEMAKRMGVSSDLKDTPSLPIGAVDITVMDMTAGYSVFANGGLRGQAYAAIEILNAQGEVIWRQDRDAPKPPRVLSPEVVRDMNFMLSKVPTDGTGRRALIAPVISAGKTGTTNAYRDAWYVGYTGNLVAGVWFGNDDNSTTNNMTGGSLPAMAWKEVMGFAHEGLEIKPIPLLEAEKPVAKEAPKTTGPQPVAVLPELAVPRRPAVLSRRSVDVIDRLGTAFRMAPPREANAVPVLPSGRLAETPPATPRKTVTP